MPLVDLPPSSPAVFYSLAATLIPIFLFGGAFVARLSRPTKGLSRNRLIFLTLLVAAYGAVAITAEATAISAAVGGEAQGASRFVVILALIAGLTMTAGGIWLPWVARVRRARMDRSIKALVLIVPGAMLLLAGYSIVSQLEFAVTYADQAENQVALKIAIGERAAEIRDAEGRIDAYTYRLGRLKERLLVAIEQDEPQVRRLVRIEIDTQEKLKRLEEQSLAAIFRKGSREIAAAKPEF